MDQGHARIADPEERRAVTRQAGRITLQAVTVAAIPTAVIVVL